LAFIFPFFLNLILIDFHDRSYEGAIMTILPGAGIEGKRGRWSATKLHALPPL